MGYAQQKDVVPSNQQWIQYYNQTKLSKQWTWMTDGGFRWRDQMRHPAQYVVRTGLGYRLHENIRVAAGMAHLGSYTNDRLRRIEWRPYQEIQSSHTYGRIDVVHRFRAEQRFLKTLALAEAPATHSFNHRLRYRLMVTVPLLKLSARRPYPKLVLDVGDELFINLGRNIVYTVFDQNRLLIGPTLQLHENLDLALTYNHQFASTTTPGRYNRDGILWLGVRHKLDLTR
ncbi:Protein of unknown function [Catalinimonas alkaloidigena]|uniref:DUF2490 domain-containing protein n=2 Tax=Catalinimonas alkaloidigena TaxID=1075417 RepID=A0A1G9IVX2_9BACT|nr:Protein of unknown function [Catalinimonas alkaloidigena]